MTRIKRARLAAITLFWMATAFTPAHAQYSVLHNFGSTAGDASVLQSGAVAQGRDGSLYSTSSYGGRNNAGAVFKITTAGEEKVLYNFCSKTNCADGEHVLSGLTLRPDGHFLGATYEGGTVVAGGTIFDISQDGALTTLYNFTGGTDGANPAAPPIEGADGSFYGVTENGGSASHCGTIYRMTEAGFTLLHQFDKAHGCNPYGALVLGTDGNLYGTTQDGGTANAGVVFQVKLAPGKATVVTVLANFDASINGTSYGTLVQGNNGNFYGTLCCATITGLASVFKVTPSGTLSVLHTLTPTEGSDVSTGLVLATDGNFYGVAEQNETALGTLFQVTPAGDFSVLHTFDSSGATGTWPAGAPVQHTNGLLYGDTSYGGTGSGPTCPTGGCGVFYSWDGGLPAFVSTVPFLGAVGTSVEILGQGFDSSTTVSFNGTAATTINVVDGTYLRATVPAGATTGFVTVTTSSGTLTSNKQFVVIP